MSRSGPVAIYSYCKVQTKGNFLYDNILIATMVNLTK